MNDVRVEEHYSSRRPDDRYRSGMCRQDLEHRRFWYDVELVSSGVIERWLQRAELMASRDEVKAATHFRRFVKHDERRSHRRVWHAVNVTGSARRCFKWVERPVLRLQ